MPTLKKIPGVLTVGEALDRLEKNPNDPDPEIQRFKKSLENFDTHFIKQIQKDAQKYSEILNSSVGMIHNIAATTDFVRSSFESVRIASELFRPTIAMIQAFQTPPYLFKTLEFIAEDFARLSLPLKALGQIYAMRETPLLYYKVPELQNNIAVTNIKPAHVELRRDESLEKEFLEESASFNEETARLEGQAREVQKDNFFLDPLRETFIVWQTNVAAINLASEEGGMSKLFRVFYEYIKEKGYVDGFYKIVFIPMAEIIGMVIKKGKKDANERWVINTRGNIVKSLVKHKMADLIIISDYDRELKGYWFKVATHINIPQITS